MVTLFDSYSYDGVSAGIWVIHIEGCQIWVQDCHKILVPYDNTYSQPWEYLRHCIEGLASE